MSEEIKETKEVKEGKKPSKNAAAASKPAEAEKTPETAEAGAEGAVVKVKRKLKRNVASGIVNVQATFNNTIITISDLQGNTLCWSSAGAKGFKGSKRGTSFAAQLAGETVAKKAQEYGMRSVVVYVRGPGSGRESAVRAIAHVGIKITSIRDLTPIPHNGCRPPKKRRV